MSCLMQGIFLLQKNVSVLANYVQTVLCYSNIIKGNVIPKTNNETEDFTMKRKMVSALLCATMVAGMVVVPAANSVFKPCAAKSKQIFSFIKKYQFHIVPSYILFPDSGYISRYVVKPSFLYLYSAYDFVAHLFCQRYLLLFQYLLFRQT